MEGNVSGEAALQAIWSGPDPHGQAALVSVESVLHGLVVRSIIIVNDAVEMVDVASDVKAEIGSELDDTRAALRKSLNISAGVTPVCVETCQNDT